MPPKVCAVDHDPRLLETYQGAAGPFSFLMAAHLYMSLRRDSRVRVQPKSLLEQEEATPANLNTESRQRVEGQSSLLKALLPGPIDLKVSLERLDSGLSLGGELTAAEQ